MAVSTAAGGRTALRCRTALRSMMLRSRAVDDHCRTVYHYGRLGIDHLHHQSDDPGGQIEAVAFVVAVSAMRPGECGGTNEHQGGEHHNFGCLFHSNFLSF